MTAEEEDEFNRLNKEQNSLNHKNCINNQDYINFIGDNNKSSENDKIEGFDTEKSINADEITKTENQEIKEEDNNSISNLPLIKIDSSSKTLNNENNFSKAKPVYYLLRIVLCEGKNLAIRDIGGKHIVVVRNF